MSAFNSRNSYLDRNTLHGYQLRDLFEFGYMGLTTVQNYLHDFIKAGQILQFRSFVISQYFNEVLLIRTKNLFRLMLKYAVYIMLIIALEASVRDPCTLSVEPKHLLAVIVPIVVVYLLTMKLSNHANYVGLSYFLCVILTIVIFWSRVFTIRQNHGLHTPGITLLISMFAFLPIRIPVCICIAVMFVASSSALELLHTSMQSQVSVNQSVELWKTFDLYERLENANGTRIRRRNVLIILSETMMWSPVCLVGLFIKFGNLLRQRFAFFKLGKSVEARQQCKSALEHQVRWIEAIMPSCIREEYQRLRSEKLKTDGNLWVFNKSYNAVSILFADIVGFTKMSSNKTAPQVVAMLNNLFNRFDELCDITKCEKIGTLGDCYYCVSGCPKPSPDHAKNCIEMGLGMCRIIKVFNCDYCEDVSMRVGVHTGRVNAAIIGTRRFRFDVYSYDVIIANSLESSGRPGRVHVSEKTFDLVKTIYNFSEGEPLAIKKEEVRGIAGMELVTTFINTYFVDPRSSLLRKKHEKYGREPGKFFTFATQQTIARTSSLTNRSSDEPYSDLDTMDTEKDVSLSTWSYVEWARLDRIFGDRHESIMDSFSRDMKLVQNLKTDPEKQYHLFLSPPLWPPLLTFYDPETEWHYNAHLYDYINAVYIDSQKVAPINDVCICLVLLIFFQFNCSLHIEHGNLINLKNLVYYLLIMFVYLSVCGCLIFIASTYHSMIQSKIVRIFYEYLIQTFAREICIGFITILPSVLLHVFIISFTNEQDLIRLRSTLSAIGFHCLIIHCIPLSSRAWARIICSLISMAIIMYTFTSITISCASKKQILCDTMILFHNGVPLVEFLFIYFIELIACFGLIITVTRENEVNCRLCFYVSREAEITTDEAEKAANEAKDLLNNIIPNYVLKELESWGQLKTDSKTFHYAVTIQESAVAFATISNFFSKYYREDYKGGENALKLLNSIVCLFDNLLDQDEMKDVEKIKTINDCYMIASGLNKEEIKHNHSKDEHLIALMNYCHLLIDELNKFNDMYIIGTDNFEIKIGYNIGPLTAGIIGTTKPMYDIWGNTVNVASRMYTTGVVGCIQVPDYVAERLSNSFKFTYRGEVFVKGKGIMKTFLCERLSSN